MTDNSTIIKEAVRRSLHSGMLTAVDPLWTPQVEALEGYSDFLNGASAESDTSAFADMATGSGKTGVFSVPVRHAHQFARESGLGNSFRTVITVPSLQLITQTHKMLTRVAPELKGAIGFYGDGHKDLSKPVSIITNDAWLDLVEAGELSDENVSYQISDEAHRNLSMRRRGLFSEKLAGTVHFGVTASSEYDIYKTLELTHRNRIYKLDLPSGIERGFLTDYAHVQHYVMRILPDMMKDKDAELSNGEFTLIKRLEWAKFVTHIYATGIDDITGQPLSDKIGIAFAADTRHADGLAARLNSNPILQRKARERGFKNVAISIHSKGYTHKMQEALLEQFMNGDFMMAVGDKKFQLGFDYDRIKFVASFPEDSLVNTIQETGRATRLYFDPVTGERQGTVILSAIPYIGNVDPEKNAKARDEALEKVVTAKKILGRSLILGPGRPPRVEHSEPKIRAPRKPMVFSPQSEVEVYVTEEETLTISRQIDAAYEQRRAVVDKEDLTEEKLVSWIKATLEKTGRAPTSDDSTVYGYQTDGGIEVIPHETWHAIDASLKYARRGLTKEDGSSIAASLSDLNKKYGFVVDKGDLTEEQIVSWIRATLEKTGKVPTMDDNTVYGYQADGSIEIVPHETWMAIDYSLRNGRRGLTNKDGSLIASGISDLNKKHGFIVDKGDLTEEQIVSWIRATIQETGRTPTVNDKAVYGYQADDSIEIVPGETWTGISQSLEKGRRGLVQEDGSLIADGLFEFKKKYGFATDKENLTEEQIVSWIKATLEKKGKLPTQTDMIVYGYQADGGIKIVPDETWKAIDACLTNARRGLVKEDGSLIAASLSDLKRKHGFAVRKPSTRYATKQTVERQDVTPVENDSGSSPAPSDPAEIARKTVTDLFAGFSDNLVSRITDAVVARLQGQLPVTTPIGAAPRQQRRAATVKSSQAEPEIKTPEKVTETPPEAVTVFAPNPEPDPAAVVQVNANIPFQESEDVNLLRFNSPLFAKPDARGDSMQSCLTNAYRAYGNHDPIGLRGNIRKFVELFIHNTLMAFDDNHIKKLEILEQYQKRIEKIVRDYRYTCAAIQTSEAKGDGNGPHLKLSELSHAFRDLISVLSVAKPETFSPRISGRVMAVIAAGGDIHIQIKDNAKPDDAHVLKFGHEIASWFNTQFGTPEESSPIVTTASNSVPYPTTVEIVTDDAVAGRSRQNWSTILLADSSFLTKEAPQLLGRLEALNIKTKKALADALTTKFGTQNQAAGKVVDALLAGEVINLHIIREVAIKKSMKDIAEIAGISAEVAFEKSIRAEQENRANAILGSNERGQSSDKPSGHNTDRQTGRPSLVAAFKETDRPSRPVPTARATDKSPVLSDYPFASENLRPLLKACAGMNPAIVTAINFENLLMRKGYEQHAPNVVGIFEGKIEILQSDGETFSPAAIAVARAVGLNPKVAYEDILNNRSDANADVARGTTEVTTPYIQDQDVEPVIGRLSQAFPIFGHRIRELGIKDMGALIKAVPSAYLGDPTMFAKRVEELAVSGQQYDVSRGKLKSAAQVLQTALGPSQGEALFEDKKILRQMEQYHQERQEFSQLMKKRAPRILFLGVPHGTKAMSDGAFKVALESQFRNDKTSDRTKEIPTYVKLYSGETLPIDGTNLRRQAAAMMELLKISSIDVAAIIPELDGNLLYTDTVRSHFPNLARLMCRDELLTVSAVKAYAGKALTLDLEMALLIDLNDDNPSAFRKSAAAPFLANIFGVPEDLLISDKEQPLPSRGAGSTDSQKPALDL